jgi:hypothetical protein
MSYNGTGTFNINTAGQPVVTGTTITSTAFNLLTADLATGLTTALTKDGQTTPTANIPMGTYKITGLGAGSSATDAAQYGQLQAGATTIATVTGTDTLTGSLTPALAAYATGNKFSFVAAATNTGAATINLNSLGAKSITKSGSTALVAGDLVINQMYLIEYDGTRFQLINPSSVSGVSSISFGSTGLTPSTATSGAVSVAGTLAVANGGTGVTTSTGSGNNVLSTSPTLVTPILGTPSSGTLTSCTGLPISTGVSGLGTNVATFLATPTSANLAAALTDETGSGANVFATSPTLVTPLLGTPTSGTLSNCTVDGTNSVGFLNIPQNSQSAAYTLVLADAGKHIFHPSGDANARTYTIPANGSVAYPIGTAITFINMTSQVVTIAITTDTMYLSSAGTTGSRSLAQYGSATAIKMTSTTWLISGSGLT